MVLVPLAIPVVGAVMLWTYLFDEDERP